MSVRPWGRARDGSVRDRVATGLAWSSHFLMNLARYVRLGVWR